MEMKSYIFNGFINVYVFVCICMRVRLYTFFGVMLESLLYSYTFCSLIF